MNSVDSNLSARVGQEDLAAGETQIIRPSIELPAPMSPVSPSTVIVIVEPIVLTVVATTDLTLFAAALIVSATFTKEYVQELSSVAPVRVGLPLKTRIT